MEFIELVKKQKAHFAKMTDGATRLFRTSVTAEELWETYLEAFPAGTNEVFRKRREYDCSCCRHFIRDIGNVVAIKGGKVVTVWDFVIGEQFAPVVKSLADKVRAAQVVDVWFSREATVGTIRSIEGGGLVWNHFHLEIPERFRHRGNGESVAAKVGQLRDVRNVFKRSLEEITPDAVETTLELIASNSLYRGEESKAVLQKFRDHQKTFSKLKPKDRELYAWEQEPGEAVGKIRNHAIGTLLVDLSGDMDLDEAVRRFEAVMAPANYKRPTPVFSKKMLEDAQKTVENLGLSESLGRRHATLEDLRAPEQFFIDRDAAKRIGGGSPFDDLSKQVAVNPRNFSKVEEIGIDKFLSDVLPTAKGLEVFMEGRHERSLVSMIAPANGRAPSLLKWDNGFSWAYAGNIADSDIKDRVKAAGGRVDGVLRFSIRWNEKGDSNDDLDAHARTSSGEEIAFRHTTSRCGGMLDVDIQCPQNDPRAVGGVAVENIIWPSKGKMKPGEFSFFVHNYCSRGARSGFSAEIEFDGQVYEFHHGTPLRNGEVVQVAKVKFDGTSFTMLTDIDGKATSREVWGLATNQFHKVSVVTHSPNHWRGEKKIGNRHVFFMLPGCRNPEEPCGFFNEYLRDDLSKHRKVFEALGVRMRVAKSDDQLSGLGFCSTKRDSLVVRVSARTSRIIKITF